VNDAEVSFELEDLRSITKEAIEKNNKDSEIKITPLSDSSINNHIQNMEKDIQDFAKQGFFEVFWDFGTSNIPLFHVRQISKAFKQKHPQFRQKTHSGTLKISVYWGTEF